MTAPVSEEPSVRDLLRLVGEATERLGATVHALDTDALFEPSGLASWSRAHVLTHLARNADGLRSLLLAARTGEALRMYASPETRDADNRGGFHAARRCRHRGRCPRSLAALRRRSGRDARGLMARTGPLLRRR